MITQQELEQRLLAACNCLRGPVDPTDYKAYIFPLLFLKRISDYWDWEYARAFEAFGGDEALARLDDNFRFVLPEECHWADVQAQSENVGVGLQTILQRIELANSDTLPGIFGDVQWANREKLPEHALMNVIEEFSTLALSPADAPGDVLGAAYEYLLNQPRRRPHRQIRDPPCVQEVRARTDGRAVRPRVRLRRRALLTESVTEPREPRPRSMIRATR